MVSCECNDFNTNFTLRIIDLLFCILVKMNASRTRSCRKLKAIAVSPHSHPIRVDRVNSWHVTSRVLKIVTCVAIEIHDNLQTRVDLSESVSNMLSPWETRAQRKDRGIIHHCNERGCI